MADRPIAFSDTMMYALLDGRKTQTRRGEKLAATVKPGDRLWCRESYYQRGHWEPVLGAVTRKGRRQKWRFVAADDAIRFDAPLEFRKGRHASDPSTVAWHRRLARFMPRALSRLTLIVEEVRVQRLQDISEEDARAEGAVDAEWDQWREDALNVGMPAGSRIENERDAFARLWNRVNSRKPDDPRAWRANPWVAALTFRVEHRNIDTL